MTRITRKELKKDEFAAEVSKTYEFFQQNREKLIRFGIAAAVLAVIIVGSLWAYQTRKRHAAEELTHALRVRFSTTPLPGMSYTDETGRDQAAEKEFASIAQKYPSLAEGREARYYLGATEDDLGKTDAAIRDLSEVAGKNDARLSPLAKYALAGVYVKTGKVDQAEKLYRELVTQPSDSVPKATAQLALADVLQASKPAEAHKILEEVSKDSKTNGAAASVAARRLTSLKQ